MASSISEKDTGTATLGNITLTFGITGDEMVIIAVVAKADSGTAPDFVVPTSAHGTWTEIAGTNQTFTDGGSFTGRGALYYLMPSTTQSSGDVTITRDGTNIWNRAAAWAYGVTELVTTGTPRGADAILDSDGTVRSSSAGTQIIGDLSGASPTSEDVVIVAAGAAHSTVPTTFGFDGSYTEHSGGDITVTDLAGDAGYIVGGDASPQVDWTNDGNGWLGSVVLDNSGGGGGGSGPRPPGRRSIGRAIGRAMRFDKLSGLFLPDYTLVRPMAT